jgi:hypothetical protein
MHLDFCGKMCVAPLVHQIGSILQDLLIWSEGETTEIVIQWDRNLNPKRRKTKREDRQVAIPPVLV